MKRVLTTVDEKRIARMCEAVRAHARKNGGYPSTYILAKRVGLDVDLVESLWRLAARELGCACGLGKREFLKAKERARAKAAAKRMEHRLKRRARWGKVEKARAKENKRIRVKVTKETEHELTVARAYYALWAERGGAESILTRTPAPRCSHVARALGWLGEGAPAVEQRRESNRVRRALERLVEKNVLPVPPASDREHLNQRLLFDPIPRYVTRFVEDGVDRGNPAKRPTGAVEVPRARTLVEALAREIGAATREAGVTGREVDGELPAALTPPKYAPDASRVWDYDAGAGELRWTRVPVNARGLGSDGDVLAPTTLGRHEGVVVARRAEHVSVRLDEAVREVPDRIVHVAATGGEHVGDRVVVKLGLVGWEVDAAIVRPRGLPRATDDVAGAAAVGARATECPELEGVGRPLSPKGSAVPHRSVRQRGGRARRTREAPS